MFEKETTQILLKFLERKCREAEKEIEEKGVLSDDKAVPLLLKSQFNHIAHLDSEITALRELMDKRFEQIDRRFEQEQVDRRFEQVDKRFEQVDRRFEQVEQKFERVEKITMWLVGLGITAWISIIIAIVIKK
jgi:hypothetical protein